CSTARRRRPAAERDRTGSRRRWCSQDSLGAGDGIASGVFFDGLAQGAGEGLVLGLDDVVRIATAHEVEVDGQSAVEGDGLQRVGGHRSGEVTADEVVLL